MDQQWQAFSENRQGRYSHATTQHPSRDLNNGSAQQHHAPSYGYEAYQTPSVPSQNHSTAASPIGTPRARAYSGDGDVAMEDADPYNRLKVGVSGAPVNTETSPGVKTKCWAQSVLSIVDADPN